MIPPPFLPPSTPRPITSYIRMGTADELRRAITPLAVFIVQGHVEFWDAHDMLCQAFVRHVWSGRSDATLLKFEDRALAALQNAIERYEASWPAEPFPKDAAAWFEAVSACGGVTTELRLRPATGGDIENASGTHAPENSDADSAAA